MDYKIVSFDEVYEYIGMPAAFWNEADGMGDEDKKKAIRDSLFWPDGFLEQLKPLTIEAQMERYGILENDSYSKSSYGQTDSEKQTKNTYKLSEYPGLNALIVEDGVVIGVCIDSCLRGGSWGLPAFPYQDICTYISCDNDGTGSSDREDYAQLICIKL